MEMALVQSTMDLRIKPIMRGFTQRAVRFNNGFTRSQIVTCASSSSGPYRRKPRKTVTPKTKDQNPKEESSQNSNNGKSNNEEETEPRAFSESIIFEEESEKPDLLSFIDKQNVIIGTKMAPKIAETKETQTKPKVEELKLKRESEEEKKPKMDPETYRKIVQKLAEENLRKGIPVFVFPENVIPDSEIEIFLNRDLSAVKDRPDVLIKGAFNGWKWKHFTEKLNKTELNGDWWSCKLFVPKQAYEIDFVFFDGGEVYENNNSKDFLVNVQNSIDEASFEEFLIEEKQREIERALLEQKERERQEEEKRRREKVEADRNADLAQARAEVAKKKEGLSRVVQNSGTFSENLWEFEPRGFKGGDRVRLFYNRKTRPLENSSEIWLHGGFNNWYDGLSLSEKLTKCERNEGDWWYTDVLVPERAIVVDWVFADGPPQEARNYDNNNFEDFHAIVPNSISEELFWVEEESRIFRRLQHERKSQEEAAQRKAERTARMKSEMKDRTIRSFLLSQKHIVYTDPVEVQAGSAVTVLYNPANTVLNGRTEVWFRGSFNRWTHRAGPMSPKRMVKAQNNTHLKTTVKVPLDAYMMDFVFSEREDGGIFDNRNGMDYHIPVYGGIVKEPPIHIVHIAVEMAPIAKVGGLGDVVTSLSRAVQDLGHNVEIILPKYDCMNLSNVRDLHCQKSFQLAGTEIKVWFGKVEGLSVYFLEPQNGMFWVGCVYGRGNDAERFGFFCHSALEFLLQTGSQPDILHCHDWSSAPVAWLFKEHYMHYGLSNAKVIFTIHNLEFGIHQISRAMIATDKATTVSHTYSKEVSGNPAIVPHLYKFHGILNGIDLDIWDPYNDNYIPVPYTSENVVEGKKAAKIALQQKLGLRVSAEFPVVGIITRLTAQKGVHLIKHAIWRALERNCQVVLLGSAPDPRIQNDFVGLGNQLHSAHADRARLVLTYDEPLSHLIYAGSDFILVPSMFEPCGLTQLTAMRYGSIPVVRKTGGLYDTVFDVENDKKRAHASGVEPNGFSFDGADAAGVDYALNRAITAWYDAREWFDGLCKRVMEQDWSWNRPALDYLELYHSSRKS
ncbi:hypothetical protein LUZ60_009063 [Juncus effusus]|nr:hypothetical protein LUZ60_009063 [Juncus effusus]